MKIYSDKDLSKENKEIYNNSKFKIGEPIRIKKLVEDDINIIFYIEYVDILGNNILYRIKDDKYIYAGLYKEEELVKISDEEKIQLKYNL